MNYKMGNGTHILTACSLGQLFKMEDEVNYTARWRECIIGSLYGRIMSRVLKFKKDVSKQHPSEMR